MTTRKTIKLCSLVILAVFAVASTGWCQRPTPIRLAYASPTITNAPIWIGDHRLGQRRRAGDKGQLRVDAVFFEDAKVGAGEIQFAQMGIGPAIPALKEVIVPPIPGNFSAYGMLLSDLKYDLARTRLIPLTVAGLDIAAAGLLKLEEAACQDLCEQGAERGHIEVSWMFDMRYRGQAYELPVAVPRDPKSLSVEDIQTKFGGLHERRYGHRAEDAAVEIVSLRVRAHFPLGKANPPRTEPSRSRSAPSYRKVRFRSGCEEAAVLARDHLAAGFEGEGPLILEEQTSTVVIEPGWKVRVDGTGNLTLRN